MMGTTFFGSANQKEQTKEFPHILKQLQNSLHKDASNLYQKIQQAIIGNYSSQQRVKIQGLIDSWSDQFMKLEDMIDDEELFNEQSIKYYLSIDCLAARVYLRITEYFVRVRGFDMGQQQTNELKEFCDILNKEDLVFSYDRFFWGRRTIKNKYYTQQNEKKRRQEIKKSLNKVYEEISNCANTTIKKVYKFMSRLQIINFSEQIEVNNQLILKLQRISKEDQKIQFLHSLQASYLSGFRDLFNNNVKSHEQKQQTEKSINRKLPNYLFYKQDKENNINRLHEQFGDYKFLQQRHDYIQWMFPNHYGSAFNSRSSPLSYLEKRLFINDQMVGFRMLKSIYTFFDFMGISLNLKDLSLKVISYPRLKAVILINYHNHLRIMRILACLSVIGFRKIALNLIKLLDEQTSQNRFLSKERDEFEKSWDIYGDQSPGVPKIRAKQMCFHQENQFPQDHSILHLLELVNSKNENIPAKQIENQMKIEDIQQFNPPTTQQTQVSANKQEKATLEQVIPQQIANNKETELNQVNTVESNITPVHQIQKIEQEKVENGLAQKSEPEAYLANIQGSQIIAKNTTVTQSD